MKNEKRKMENGVFRSSFSIDHFSLPVQT